MARVSNPNIPLSVKNFSIAEAIQQGKRDKTESALAEFAVADAPKAADARDLGIAIQQQNADTRERQVSLQEQFAGREGELRGAAELAIRVSPMLDGGDIEGALRFTEQFAQERGDTNAQKFAQILRTDPEQARAAAAGALEVARQFKIISSDGGIPAAIADRNDLIGNFSEGDQRKARRIEAGLDPRAVGSSTQTIATTPGLTGQVAASQAEITESKKFAELTGSSRAKAIDSGFESIKSIDQNIKNIDRAIAELEAGAQTGVIESQFFPSLTEATLKLEQIQGELALDVVGATTFGALSKGELDLAREVALPTGLQPAALQNYLEGKRSAQEKLRAYYAEQIDFLDQGGTVAGFLRSKERSAPKAESKRLKFDAQGNSIAN